MSKSPLTYAGALAILGKGEQPLLEKLDKLLGGVILAGTAVAGPASWAFLEPKSESTRLIKSLLDRAKQRALGTSGHSRRELLAAAHTVLVVSSFFDAVSRELGPRYDLLEITDEEKLRLFGGSAPGERRLVDQLLELRVPLPSATTSHSPGHSASLAAIYHSLSLSTVEFISGLAVADRVLRGVNTHQLITRIAGRANHNCWDSYLTFAADIPEFAIWLSWTHDDVLENRLESFHTETRQLLAGHSVALSKLHELLTLTVADRQPAMRSYRERLAMANRAVLEEPLLRSGSQVQAGGLAFPTVERGFVTPHFRVARQATNARPTEESWWQKQARRTGLDEFLAAHLSSLDSTELPLLVLGHPGAGKSLLTEVLAARLPATGFTVVRVPLRRVEPSAPVHEQIGNALELVLKERVDWGRFTEECHDTVRIVILDGLDELILATGVTQSAYLHEVARFQKEELAMGRPVAVIVTSRTLVVDRARIPEGCPLIKLAEFDDDQVEAWLSSWNNANVTTAGFRPMMGEELRHHGELARQPLVLLILAVYAAEPDTGRLDAEDLSRADLYQRLLDSFIRRQVRDKSVRPLSSAEEVEQAVDKRWRLSTAAFGMFNRGRQYIADSELELDIASFRPNQQPGERSTFAQQVSRAEQTIAEFFFVHVSQSRTDIEANEQRTYEFLHSTFGEYLIAEYTMRLLRRLANQLDSDGLPVREVPHDDQLFALLAHKVLLTRQRIIEFAQEIMGSLESGMRRHVRRLLTELLRQARSSARTREYTGYEPTRFDSVCRLATYTANLAVLRVTLDGGLVTPAALAPPDSDPMRWWRSQVHLWESGLDEDGWEGVGNALTLSYGSEPVVEARTGFGRGAVLGAHTEELHTYIGSQLVGDEVTIHDDDEWELYVNLERIALGWVGTSPLDRLLPDAENSFERVAAAISRGSKLSHDASITLWRVLSRSAPQLPFPIVSKFVSLLLTGQATRGGKRWELLGCELAAVVAAHPQLVSLNDDVAALAADFDFPATVTDASAAVAILWAAEQASQEHDRRMLREMRVMFDQEAASTPELLDPTWLPPSFLTYLRIDRPSYWNIGDVFLYTLAESLPYTLSRIEPVDALYVVTAHSSDGSHDEDVEGPVLSFVRAYLEARGQPIDDLGEDNAVETLAHYAELPVP